VDARLPAHLEVAGIIRTADTAGGFALVTFKGERDAGSILLLTMERGENAVLFERMPQLDGSRKFVETKRQESENKQLIYEYLDRRKKQDPDIWVLEVDIAHPAQFIASLTQ